MNVIADVAGQYEALMRLVDKMPKDDFLFVGDLIDRGRDSSKVVDWVMNNAQSLMGNHEHMCIDFYDQTQIYDPGLWQMNGGNETVLSYSRDATSEILQTHLAWMRKLPLYYVDYRKKLFISHAPFHPRLTLEQALQIGTRPLMTDSIIWNRDLPARRATREVLKDALQLSGHNSPWGLRYFEDADGLFAICLDDCAKYQLTGYNTEEKKIYQVVYP